MRSFVRRAAKPSGVATAPRTFLPYGTHAALVASSGSNAQVADSQYAGRFSADKEIERALGGLHLGDFDVEDDDRVAPELLALRLVTANGR